MWRLNDNNKSKKEEERRVDRKEKKVRGRKKRKQEEYEKRKEVYLQLRAQEILRKKHAEKEAKDNKKRKLREGESEEPPKKKSNSEWKKQAEFENLNKQSESKDDEDVISTSNEYEKDETRVEEKKKERNSKSKKEVYTSKVKNMKKAEKEKHVESGEQDVFYEGRDNNNEGLLVEKTKKTTKKTNKTESLTSKVYLKKQSKNESGEEDYDESYEEEEIKKLQKVKMEKVSKPGKAYPTCNTRSSTKALYDAMMSLSDARKKLLKEIGFERFIHFPIVELPSTLAFYVIENFYMTSMELRLERGSIKATRQKVHDMLGIPIGSRKLEDLEQRPSNDPFITVWEDQFRHLQKPTLPAIAGQISSTEELKCDFTLRDGVTKFEEDQMIFDFCNKYEELFNDDEFNLNESYMDEDSDGDGDVDNDNNKNNDEGATMADGNKQKGGTEAKDDGEQVQDHVNNDHEFGKLTGDDTEVAVSTDVDNQKEEIIRNKDGNETEVNEKMNNNEMKNDFVQKEEQVETEKEKQDEADKVEKLETQATQDYKMKKTPKRKSIEDMTPPTCSLGLSPLESELKSTKTKDMFKWKKADGKFDEAKQYEAFSKTMKSEFKKDVELKKMKDLEMAFFPIIAHEHYYLIVFNFLKGTTVVIDNSKTQMTDDAMYKTVCDLLSIMYDKNKNMFYMHLKEVQHPRATYVLNKNPTILIPKWGTKENDIDCGVFLMMHIENYNWETTKNWNLKFLTENEGNTYDVIKMRVRFAAKMLSHEINIHHEKISHEALEFVKCNNNKKMRKELVLEAIKMITSNN
ncbi:ulp1 protease family, C-terminal catalytic domain-containing protein [Tanacetum coccineum]